MNGFYAHFDSIEQHSFDCPKKLNLNLKERMFASTVGYGMWVADLPPSKCMKNLQLFHDTMKKMKMPTFASQ